MIEMNVTGIAIDAATRSPIVLLEDGKGRRALPIYIGEDQARAIGSVLKNVVPPRPTTHDLFINLMEASHLALERVVIHSLKDSTFYAVLTIKNGDSKYELDARPSDAIALALRARASIWVMEEVVADASIPVDREADEAERKAFRDFVSNLSPSELIQRSRFSGDNS
ncbi:MAG: bifunctional nuclease family protein [Synechococcales bacterium]|nr:bifunctional nuclease family protein [Synechococcales bacterium]